MKKEYKMFVLVDRGNLIAFLKKKPKKSEPVKYNNGITIFPCIIKLLKPLK